MMNRFDPYALFFDQPEGGLLKDALVVSRVGVEVLAARSLEEARQIFEAQGQRPASCCSPRKWTAPCFPRWYTWPRRRFRPV